MKKALITGITGQDGSYLTELLLEKPEQVAIGCGSVGHGIACQANAFGKRHDAPHPFLRPTWRPRRLDKRRPSLESSGISMR